MTRLLLLLTIPILLSACASTNTGNPELDKINAAQNARDRVLVGRGIARFLDGTPQNQTLEEQLFGLPAKSDK